MQTKGASQIYKNALDAVVKTFQQKGILGFYSGVSAVIVGSTASSAVYFGTCEFGKSFLSKFEGCPSVLIPPSASAVRYIVLMANIGRIISDFLFLSKRNVIFISFLIYLSK